MQKFMPILSVVMIAMVAICSCSNKTETIVQQPRSFYMGTKPWPADLTIDKVDKTYQFINNHCDIF
jgi:uncharacterized lipoprotein